MKGNNWRVKTDNDYRGLECIKHLKIHRFLKIFNTHTHTHTLTLSLDVWRWLGHQFITLNKELAGYGL